MEMFESLESRVVRLIEAYQDVKARAAALEQENAALRAAGASADVAALQQRIATLEQEREEVRARLERLIGQIEALEV